MSWFLECSEKLTEACFRSRDNVRKLRSTLATFSGAPQDTALGALQYIIIALRVCGLTIEETMEFCSLACARAHAAGDPPVSEVYKKDAGPVLN